MSDAVIKAIETILARGERVELIPGPGSTVKVVRIKRTTAVDTGK